MKFVIIVLDIKTVNIGIFDLKKSTSPTFKERNIFYEPYLAFNIQEEHKTSLF